MERSHRTDDEEFYLPFLGKVQTEGGFLKKAAGWVYYYNLERPHYGEGMDAKPPFRKLRELRYDLPEEFALFPPLVLDRISADWALRGGNDLLAHYSEACRAKHYSPRTEEAYVRWIERFLRFHRERAGAWVHPRDLDATGVESFLTHLAVKRQVSASTQNQAVNVLVFFYRDVLQRELGDFDAVRAKRPIRLPTVLSQEETARVLAQLGPDTEIGLMAHLLYGSGLRLMECCLLRVMDADLDRGQIMVRSGKGEKDRITMLPLALRDPLRGQIERVRRQHERNLSKGRGWGQVPPSVEHKRPSAPRELGWQFLFPSSRCVLDARRGRWQTWHVHPRAR